MESRRSQPSKTNTALQIQGFLHLFPKQTTPVPQNKILKKSKTELPCRMSIWQKHLISGISLISTSKQPGNQAPASNAKQISETAQQHKNRIWHSDSRCLQGFSCLSDKPCVVKVINKYDQLADHCRNCQCKSRLSDRHILKYILLFQLNICHDLILMKSYTVDHFCILRILIRAKQRHALIQWTDPP